MWNIFYVHWEQRIEYLYVLCILDKCARNEIIVPFTKKGPEWKVPNERKILFMEWIVLSVAHQWWKLNDSTVSIVFAKCWYFSLGKKARFRIQMPIHVTMNLLRIEGKQFHWIITYRTIHRKKEAEKSQNISWFSIISFQICTEQMTFNSFSSISTGLIIILLWMEFYNFFYFSFFIEFFF